MQPALGDLPAAIRARLADKFDFRLFFNLFQTCHVCVCLYNPNCHHDAHVSNKNLACTACSIAGGLATALGTGARKLLPVILTVSCPPLFSFFQELLALLSDGKDSVRAAAIGTMDAFCAAVCHKSLPTKTLLQGGRGVIL